MYSNARKKRNKTTTKKINVCQLHNNYTKLLMHNGMASVKFTQSLTAWHWCHEASTASSCKTSERHSGAYVPY